MADCIQSTPIVQSRPASKEYCDGWERVFGAKRGRDVHCPKHGAAPIFPTLEAAKAYFEEMSKLPCSCKPVDR